MSQVQKFGCVVYAYIGHFLRYNYHIMMKYDDLGDFRFLDLGPCWQSRSLWKHTIFVQCFLRWGSKWEYLETGCLKKKTFFLVKIYTSGNTKFDFEHIWVIFEWYMAVLIPTRLHHFRVHLVHKIDCNGIPWFSDQNGQVSFKNAPNTLKIEF